MAVSRWEQYDFENRITQMLNELRYDDPKHYGQPFVTAYQLAIEFSLRYPQDFSTIGLPVGGEGTGERNSLAQYIAKELSQRLSDERITHMQIAWIHQLHFNEMSFKYEAHPIKATGMKVGYAVSIFRLVN